MWTQTKGSHPDAWRRSPPRMSGATSRHTIRSATYERHQAVVPRIKTPMDSYHPFGPMKVGQQDSAIKVTKSAHEEVNHLNGLCAPRITGNRRGEANQQATKMSCHPVNSVRRLKLRLLGLLKHVCMTHGHLETHNPVLLHKLRNGSASPCERLSQSYNQALHGCRERDVRETGSRNRPDRPQPHNVRAGRSLVRLSLLRDALDAQHCHRPRGPAGGGADQGGGPGGRAWPSDQIAGH